MTRFLKKIVLYFFAFLTVLSLLCCVGFYLARVEILNHFPKTETIILGDSNTERGINDSLLISSTNFSSTAENYRLSFYKLQFIHKQNKSLKRVILSFSPHNLFFAFPNNHRHSHSALIVLEPSDYSDYYSGNITLKRCFYTLNYGLKHLIDLLFKNEIKLGGFTNIAPENSQFEFWHTNFCKTLEESPVNEISGDQIRYLNAIITYCKKNDLEIQFLVLPKHQILLEDSAYHANEFVNFYEQHYREIPILNYAELPMNENEFQDPMHLNSLGAKKLTQKLAESLTSF